MKANQIITEPFKFISIQKLKIVKKVNEHSKVFLSGYISVKSELDYINICMRNENTPFLIKIIDEEEGNENTTIFSGVIIHFEITKEGDFCTLNLEARSSTYLMDIQKHFRTFQNVDMKYSEILDLVKSNYEYSDFLIKIEDECIGEVTIQYEETDWEFLQRIASYSNSYLVPADNFPGIRYYLDMPYHLLYEIEDKSYTMFIDSEEFHDKKARGMDIHEVDACYYVIQKRECYHIGDEITFNGIKLHIHEMISEIQNQELIHTYYLKRENGFKVPRTYNVKQTGVSLEATVIDVQKDMVKISINKDENKEQSIYQWFPFSTVYSSSDGTGWYFMPEPGDRVCLYIPGCQEKEAFVFNSVHLDSLDGARTNPDIKSLKTKYGKEIRFAPNSLRMTNNSGMTIELSDENGISIESDKNITIKADGDIDIYGNSTLTFAANDEINLGQGETRLIIDDDINFKGGKVRME